jgi:hypothetical protein
MTYSVGNTIVATDYNGFISTNAANINGIWSTGAASFGYGETAVSTVSAAATITATQWSTLNSRLVQWPARLAQLLPVEPIPQWEIPLQF